ncbi:MFS transporter [Micrococcus sp.]|uniref:MFS transporter n=1 Tax=Micrococcus sp. TaxID=1271 RepID=UPI0026DB0B63|nr:MFS transporter [Micrococcus sp.]MDO4240574.1 MFS transporter [Micrococcus sp.]
MTITPSSPPARAATPSSVALIGVAAFSCLVVALQQTLVVPAVPRLPAVLGETPGAVSWLVTATLLSGAVATPIIARLSDMFGRRRLMVVAMLAVLLGSVVAPLGGLPMLILGRALQGLGTAVVPVAMAQMRDSLPPERTSTALAVLSAVLGVGGGVGIPLGGLIVTHLDWTWLFWVSALLSVASLVAIALVIPHHRPDRAERFDLTGAVLLSVGLLALLTAVSQGNAWGWTSVATLGFGVVGLFVLVGWGAVELRTVDPLVDLRATAATPVLLTNVASLLLGVLMFANLLLTTLQLQNPVSQDGFGWSASAAGLAMLPNAAAMLVVAPLTAWMSHRWGPRWILAVGALVTAAGYLGRMLVSTDPTAAIVWATVVGFGVGIGYSALPMLIVAHAEARHIGAANGVNALVRAIGTALASAGVSALAALLAVEAGGRTVPGPAAFTVVGTLAVAFALGVFAAAAGIRQRTHP